MPEQKIEAAIWYDPDISRWVGVNDGGQLFSHKQERTVSAWIQRTRIKTRRAVPRQRR